MYSNIVLQYIRKNIFRQSIGKMYRIMRYGGIAYHMVVLKDMIGGKKNI